MNQSPFIPVFLKMGGGSGVISHQGVLAKLLNKFVYQTTPDKRQSSWLITIMLRKLLFIKTLWMKPPHQRPPLPLLNHLSITSGLAYYWGGSAVINGSPTFEWQTVISQSAHACETLYSFNHHFYLTVHNCSLKPCWNQDLTLHMCVIEPCWNVDLTLSTYVS